MFSRKLVFSVLILCSFALFAYSCVRAYKLSFTHDESLSYSILMGDVRWKSTANHHPLNTLFMGWADRWLGSSEWQLRLPNVISHMLYLGFGLLLLGALRHSEAILLGFALLNLNPFLLDFFSLARGYGLALGLTVSALFFLWQAWRQPGLIGRAGLLFLSLTCASLADLANFSWLNVHLPLLAVSVIVLLYDGSRLIPWNRKAIGLLILIAGSNIWFIWNLARRILALRLQRELYGRGTNDFITDTLGSLVGTYFYTRPYSPGLQWSIVAVMIVAFAASTAWVIYRIFKERRISFTTILWMIVAAAVAEPLLEHLFLAAEYPIDRIALFYVPLGAVLTAFVIDQVPLSLGTLPRVLGRTFCLLLVAWMAAHLLRTANTHYTITWIYDANTKAAVSEIARHQDTLKRGDIIDIGNSWLFAPAINFYRTTWHYDWLSPATRDGLSWDRNDVIYCFTEDLEKQPQNYTVIERYPDTGSVLIKLDRDR
jgi:hypothetical protein